MERRLKQMLIEWRKEEDKVKVIKQMEALLFKRNEKNHRIKCKRKLILNLMKSAER